jgi:RNA polymerase sigma factor (sigma-70 family)
MPQEPMPGLSAEDPMQLALQLQRNEPRALEGVIRALGPRVAAGLKKRHPNLTAEDVEDALSVAVHRLWESRSRYDPAKGSLASWFFIIADNAAKDVLRKMSHRAERAVDPDRLAKRETPAILDEGEISTSAWPDLAQVLLCLPAVDHRIITTFAQTGGVGPWAAELGLELGMRSGAVRVRCLRIKERIRKKLQAAVVDGPLTPAALESGNKGQSKLRV